MRKSAKRNVIPRQRTSYRDKERHTAKKTKSLTLPVRDGLFAQVGLGLYRNGFGYIWEYQNNNMITDCYKELFKGRLTSQFIQEWQSNLLNSSKCSFYRHLKENFGLEKYLLTLPTKFSRKICKFRLSNHKLNIETGRYNNTERNLRYCDKCLLNLVGDEYHLFF